MFVLSQFDEFIAASLGVNTIAVSCPARLPVTVDLPSCVHAGDTRNDFAWASRFRRLVRTTASARNGGRVTLCRLRLPLPPSGDRRHRSESITPSSYAKSSLVSILQ